MLKTFRVDCHVHTNHSPDSHSRPDRIVEWARLRGLHALAITDHDTMTGIDPVRRAVARARAEITVVPGVEVTTDRRTHLLALFVSRVPSSTKLLDVIDEVHDLGGLVALPHPFRRDTGFLANIEDGRHTTGELDALFAKIDLLELSNAKSRSPEIGRLLARLPSLPRVPLCAGSDAHVPNHVGRTHVEVASPTVDGLRRGGVVERREPAHPIPAVPHPNGAAPGALRRIRLGVSTRLPSRAKTPWHALKREVTYRRASASELERDRVATITRWQRDPASGNLLELTARMRYVEPKKPAEQAAGAGR